MTLRYRLIALAVLAAFIAGILWAAAHYHGKYQDEKKRADAAEQNLSLANATIIDMQVRQRDVAALDAKYTKELADAQNTINNLRRDVYSGAKRLRVSATCDNVRKAPTSSGVADADPARLTDAAQRDYFTLRDRIETITKQLTGLQVYVHEQCMR